MEDRSRVLAAAGVGAVIGGLWGWLYLTKSGCQARDQIEPTIDRIIGELKEARATGDATAGGQSLARLPRVVDYSAALAASASTAAMLGSSSCGTPCRSCKYAGLLYDTQTFPRASSQIRSSEGARFIKPSRCLGLEKRPTRRTQRG